MPTSPKVLLRANLAHGAVHPRIIAEREDRLDSIDALALALRWACQNQGLTYSECLDRVSVAWGPGGPPSRSSALPERPLTPVGNPV